MAFCLVIVFNPLAFIVAKFPMVVESNGSCKKFDGQDCMLMYLCVKRRCSSGSRICVSLYVELTENFMEVVSILE